MSNWHQQNMRVQYKDTDQMGVVHHVNYVTWFEIGRTEWMRSNQLSYHSLEKRGMMLPVLDVSVRYKTAARFDDCVAVYSKLESMKGARLIFAYEIRRISEAAFQRKSNNYFVEPFGELLATGMTTHMWVNFDFKPIRIRKTAPEIHEILKNAVEI